MLNVNRNPASEPGLGAYAYGGASGTLCGCFTPQLAGINGLRLRCGPKQHEPDRPKLEPNWELGGAGDLVEAFSVTIGSFRGAIMGPGSDPETDRGVQVHLDWLQSGGVIFYLVRGARAIDSEVYPVDAYGQESLAHLDSGTCLYLCATPFSSSNLLACNVCLL
eukprot:COSAG05_NODE_2919_length_2511_cov_1.360282_5_plen_164_part_00